MVSRVFKASLLYSDVNQERLLELGVRWGKGVRDITERNYFLPLHEIHEQLNVYCILES